MNKVNSTHFNYTKTETTDGNYTYRVWCNSTVNGYWGNSTTRWIYVTNATPDTTPPDRYNLQPSGNPEYSSGTTSVTFSLDTNEQAFCRYATTDKIYANMTQMNSTNSTSHSHTATGLSAGQSYTYYIRCNDTVGNVNNNSVSISWSTATGGGTGGGGGTPSVTAVCGNGICEFGETSQNCPKDCGNISFSLSVPYLNTIGHPGTELRCIGFEQGCSIAVENDGNFTLSMVVTIGDQNLETVTESIKVNWTQISLSGTNNFSSNVSFDLEPLSKKRIFFRTSIPNTTELGEYKTNLVFQSSTLKRNFPITISVERMTPFSIEQFVLFLSGSAWTFPSGFVVPWWGVLALALFLIVVFYPQLKDYSEEAYKKLRKRR